MRSNDKHSSSTVSAAKKGLIALLFSILISASVMTVAYLPWKSFHELEIKCTEAATASVIENCSQEKDGVYYYGPKIEYTIPGTISVYRVEVVNTVNLNTSWKEKDALAVYFNAADPTEVILRDDHTAEKRFRTASVVSAVMLAAGFTAMIVGCIMTFKKAKPKKFDTNIAGESFEEWQKKTVKENKNSETDEDEIMSEEKEMDKDNSN